MSSAKVPLKSAKMPLHAAKVPMESARVPSASTQVPRDPGHSEAQPASEMSIEQGPAAALGGSSLKQLPIVPTKQMAAVAVAAQSVLPAAVSAAAQPRAAALVTVMRQPADHTVQTEALSQQVLPFGEAAVMGTAEGSSSLPMGITEGSAAIKGSPGGSGAVPLGRAAASGAVAIGRTEGSGAEPMGKDEGSVLLPERRESNGASQATRLADACTMPKATTGSSRDRFTSQEVHRDRSVFILPCIA